MKAYNLLLEVTKFKNPRRGQKFFWGAKAIIDLKFSFPKFS